MAGERFGPYRIEDLLGRGSMGEVHRATDLRKGRTVALKRLAVAHSDDEGFAMRFRREAEMTARLNEPHVIPIHDYGEINGQLYLDMRLVEGVDLGTALATTGPLDPPRAVAVVEQVAAALDAAHRADLVHRDVKPSNILLARPVVEQGAQGPDFAYLIDFGIAASLSDSRLTAHSTLIGTAAYMAPERFRRGASGDHRVDVYALGCVLHEALAGGAPFSVKSIHQLMHAHLHEPPPRLGALRTGLPPGLDEVVAIAMDKQPDRRYQHAGELAVAARAAISGTTSSPVPSSPLASSASGRTEAWTAPAATTSPTVPAGTAPLSSPSPAPTDEWERPVSSPAAEDATVSPPRRGRRLLTGALLLVVLGLLVLGGTAYIRSRDAAAPSAPRLPDGLVGAWTGAQSEPRSGRSFPIRIDLVPGAVGEDVGEMSFSAFECRFALSLAGTADTVDLRARPVAGPCSEGLLRARVEGPDRFSYETVAGDQVVARGELGRS